MTTKGTTTMRQRRPKRVHVPRSCSRCQRRLTATQVRDAWAVLNDGYVQATVCASCLTPEECGHMAWLEATSEVGLNIRDNRILVRQKRFPTSTDRIRKMMTPRPIEYASLAELQRRVVDTNGCDHQAGAELRRRGLAAKLGGAHRRPAELLRELELRRNPDLRTPRDRLIALEAKRHTTARGVDPRQLLLQMHAIRIDEGW